MRKNTTAKALIMSVLALMLCLSMLVGITFAWFTDSVKSGVNKIVAGNLDVELEYAKVPAGTEPAEADWKTVQNVTELFMPTEGENATLWEPGHTEYVYLRIRNAGTLALKYQFTVNVYGDANGGAEKEYTNKDGNKFLLSNYLVFNQIEGAEAVNDRTELWLSADQEADAMGDLSGLGMKGDLLLPNATEVLTLAVYMPTWVGNDANYKTGTEIPTIYLGLDLVATQTPHENDSFNDQYDKDAKLPDGYVHWDGTAVDTAWYAKEKTEYKLNTPAQLKGLADLIKAGEDFTGKTVTLEADMDLEGNKLQIGSSSKPFKGTFDGQDHEIKGVSQTLFNYPAGTADNLTEIKNVVITGDTTTSKSLVAAYPKYVHIDNVTTNGSVTADTGKAAGAFVGQITLSDKAPGEVLKITNCTNNANITLTKNGYYAGYEAGGIIGYVKYAAGANVVIENCVNNGDIKYENDAFSGDSGTAFGGIVGTAANTTIRNCFNTGAIQGADQIGGIVGTCMSGTEIRNCYNTGAVTSINPEAHYVGGIAGTDAPGSLIVDSCYSIGMISGGADNSGIVGGTRGTGDHYTKCYYLKGTADRGFSWGVSNPINKPDEEGKYIAKTEDEMKQAATYVDWDATVWNLTDGAYPTLK